MDKWDLIRRWDLILPPSRPSAAQLSMIKARIAAIERSSRVAILGSTPEFRDLLFECGFREIYLLEKNLNFLNEMSRLRVHANAERIIEGDWLNTLPMMKGTFAVILSDLTSGNIPYDFRREFYDKVADALTGGGIFLDKILTHQGKHIPLRSLIEKYSQLPLNLLYINHFSCEALFSSELLDSEQLVDSSRFYIALDEAVQDARVRAFMERAKELTPPGCIWWYGRPWNVLEPDYCVALKRLETRDDEDGSPYLGRLKFLTSVKG
jgi:hypothetical protein